MPAPIHLLVNPAAGSGRARDRIESAYAALRTIGHVELVESQSPRDETQLAIAASRARARALVVLGGDGSVSHAARGLIGEQSQTPLAVFASGTGNDFVKSLDLPAHDYLAMARVIANGHSRRIDAAEIDGVPFVNVAGFGFDVEVTSRIRTSDRSRLLKGTALYAVTALQQLFRFREFHASISALRSGERAPWLIVAFANGQWFGGAFRIAPQAAVDDGLLHCVAIGSATPLERVGLFARALRGTHLAQPQVTVASAHEFKIDFVDRPHFQADGELHHARSRSVTVRALPNALRVVSRA